MIGKTTTRWLRRRKSTGTAKRYLEIDEVCKSNGAETAIGKIIYSCKRSFAEDLLVQHMDDCEISNKISNSAHKLDRNTMADIHSKDHFTKTFNLDDTAVVLIDHQIGTCGWVHSIDADLLKKNVGILATFATKMKMPLVLTSSMLVSFLAI